MRVIDAGYEIITGLSDEAVKAIYRRIETAGRTCYKSEDKITEDSAARFVSAMVRNGHEAMLEHANMTVKFIVDRGVSHEIVRHRLASFAQESQRYCSYDKEKFGGEITFVRPCFWPVDSEFYSKWKETVEEAEKTYLFMIKNGAKPEEARSVLPNSTKTEIVVTANMREWRHFMKLRAAGEFGRPHPQMLEVTIPLLRELKSKMPELFGDIEELKAE